MLSFSVSMRLLGSRSLIAQLVKNPPAMWETWVQSLGWEDPLEKGKAIHSSILAQRSPWGCKELDTTERLTLSLYTFTLHFQADAQLLCVQDDSRQMLSSCVSLRPLTDAKLVFKHFQADAQLMCVYWASGEMLSSWVTMRPDCLILSHSGTLFF